MLLVSITFANNMERTIKPTPIKPFDFDNLENKNLHPTIHIWILKDRIYELEYKQTEYEAYIKYLKDLEKSDTKAITKSNYTISLLQNDLRNAIKYYNKIRFYIPSLPHPKTFLKKEYEWMK